MTLDKCKREVRRYWQEQSPVAAFVYVRPKCIVPLVVYAESAEDARFLSRFKEGPPATVFPPERWRGASFLGVFTSPEAVINVLEVHAMKCKLKRSR